MKNSISLFLLLLLPAFMVAHNTPIVNNSLETTKVTTNDVFTCNLPAPTGLAAISMAIGPVSLSWNPVAGAVDYRVQVYESVSGNLVSTHYTTNTSIAISPGAPQCYQFHVSAGCGAGAYSSNASVAEDCVDWVTEIVVNGYQNCTLLANGVSSGSIGANNGFTFNFVPGTRYRAVITKPNTIYNDVIHFGFVSPTTANVLMFTQGTSGASMGTLVTTNYTNCTTSGLTSLMYLTECSVAGSNAVRKVSVQAQTDANNNANLVFASMDGNTYNVAIQIVACYNKDRDSAEPVEASTENNLTAAPNPFNDEINIMRDATSDLSENAHLQLYDLTGKIYFDQDFTGQSQVSLSSEGLPAGIYILRTRVGDKVQTQKLIKND